MAQKAGLVKGTTKDGFGIYRWADTSVYEGSWKGGKQHGHGKYTAANGDLYVGDWFEGAKEGQGRHDYGKGKWEGDVYTGGFVQNQLHGEGEYRYKNGGVFRGNWVQGEKQGYGRHSYGTGQWEGDIYEGEFKNGNLAGKGHYTYKNGDFYVGDWKDNQQHGQGKFTYASDKTINDCQFLAGDEYEGGFADSKKHGLGYWDQRGKKYKCTFVQGKNTSKVEVGGGGVAAASSQMAAASISHSAPAAANISKGGLDVFISVRFAEGMKAAEALKAALERKGANTFLCAVEAGGDIFEEIVDAISNCRLAVIVGTKTYGKQTGSTFSTRDELKFIKQEKKPMFLIKMCDKFEESFARFTLGDGIAYYQWKPANEAAQSQLPNDMCDRIVAKLATC